MKISHDARYPGLNEAQFRTLLADNAYQDNLAANAKLSRSHIQTRAHGDALRTDWVSRVHRSLDQVYLRPLKAVWPNGLNVEWRETHEYRGAAGAMRLQLQNPSQVEVEGTETLRREGKTLVRHLEIDMGRVKLPLALRFLPGIKSAIGSELLKGLERADAATAQWLQDHPGRYTAPRADEVLDVPR
jgi:hypothetical protein